MNAKDTSSVALLTDECSELNELAQAPANQSWNKSAGMFAGKPSLGGVLVVDDDPAIRNIIRLILENAGYDILEARDGQEAIDLLGSGENPIVIDLIITDLTMPKVSGQEAIGFFQREYPGIPLIVLTGIPDLDDGISFMRQGISNYLVKPVQAKTLIDSVAIAVGQRQFSWA